MGTRAVIKRMARSDETIEVILQGVERIRLVGLEQATPFLRVRVEPLPIEPSEGAEVEALQRELVELTGRYQSLVRPVPGFELSEFVGQFGEPMELV